MQDLGEVSSLERASRVVRMMWHILVRHIPDYIIKAITTGSCFYISGFILENWIAYWSVCRLIQILNYECTIMHIIIFLEWQLKIVSCNQLGPLQQDSLMAKGHTLGTSCTGVYTVETALAIVEKTVNQSGLVKGLNVYYQSSRCFDPFLQKKSYCYLIQSHSPHSQFECPTLIMFWSDSDYWNK